jgi:hypothetical protein
MTETKPTESGPSMLALRAALSDTQVRLTFTFGIGPTGTKHGVLVEHRPGYSGRWARHPVVIYPSDHQSVADVMHLLATIREEERHARDQV